MNQKINDFYFVKIFAAIKIIAIWIDESEKNYSILLIEITWRMDMLAHLIINIPLTNPIGQSNGSGVRIIIRQINKSI